MGGIGDRSWDSWQPRSAAQIEYPVCEPQLAERRETIQDVGDNEIFESFGACKVRRLVRLEQEPAELKQSIGLLPARHKPELAQPVIENFTYLLGGCHPRAGADLIASAR